MRMLRLSEAERNQNRAAEWDVEFLTTCKKLRMTKKKALKDIQDFRLIYKAKLLSHVACGEDRSYWSDYRHQRMALEFSMMTWPTDKAQVYRSHEKVSQIAWIFQMGMSYRVGSDLYHWLLSKSARVAANQGMTPMEERYEGILKEEAVDKSLDAEVCTDGERQRCKERRKCVIKRLRGLDSHADEGWVYRWNKRDALGKRDRTENSNAQQDNKGISTYNCKRLCVIARIILRCLFQRDCQISE